MPSSSRMMRGALLQVELLVVLLEELVDALVLEAGDVVVVGSVGQRRLKTFPGSGTAGRPTPMLDHVELAGHRSA